jgi:hypothetical protein
VIPAEQGTGKPRANKLPAHDLAAPVRVRRFRVLVIGAQPATESVAYELARMGAVETLCLDGLDAATARHRVKVTPPDAVLVVGPLWTPGATGAPPVVTVVGVRPAS